MSRELGILARRKKSFDGRITKAEKDNYIRRINKWGKEYGFDKLSKDSTLKEVRNARNKLTERLGYDVLVLAVEEGNNITAEYVGKELKKTKDKEVKRLAEFGKDLAIAKKESLKKLSKNEANYLENANQNILGYGNMDIVSMFEATKSKKGVESLIKAMKNIDPKKAYFDNHIELFNRVFQKVGIVREDDIEKVSEHLKTLDFNKLKDASNYLLKSLEMYGSEQNATGSWGDEETELANARLDDVMIQFGIKNAGKKKVSKTLKKYEK